MNRVHLIKKYWWVLALVALYFVLKHKGSALVASATAVTGKPGETVPTSTQTFGSNVGSGVTGTSYKYGARDAQSELEIAKLMSTGVPLAVIKRNSKQLFAA